MARYLVPPARFSNAVLLTLAVAISGVVTWATGLIAVTAVGLVGAAFFFAALRLFTFGKPVYEVLASLFTVLAAIGLLATPAFALAVASARYGGVRVFIAFLVPLLFVAGLVTLDQVYFPDTGTAEFIRAVYSLLSTAALFTISSFGLVVLGLVLPALDIGQLVDVGLGFVVDGMTGTALAQLSSFAFLLGIAVYLAVLVSNLPLIQKAGRVAAAAIDPEGDEAATGPIEAVAAELNDRPMPIRRLAGSLIILGGVVTVIGALKPSLSRPLRPFTGRFLVSVVFAHEAPAHRALAWLAVVLLCVAVIHRFVWWLLHINWGQYTDQATRVAGPIMILLLVAFSSGPAVDALLRTPALHYVFPPDAGVIFEFSAEHIRVVEFSPEVAYLVPVQSTATFVPAVRALAANLGAPLLVIGALAVLFDVIMLVILVLWIVTGVVWVVLFGSIDPTSDARIGIGLLFVGTISAATLRIPPHFPLVAVVLTLLAWDIHRLTTGLQLQLDPRARTLRGELVNLGTNAAMLVGVVAVTLIGQRLMGAVPTPMSSWQGLAVLVFALAAAVSSLVAVALSED